MRTAPTLALAAAIVAGLGALPAAAAAPAGTTTDTLPVVAGPRGETSRSAAAASVAAALPSGSSSYGRITGADRYEVAVNISTKSVCARNEDPCVGKLGGAENPVDVVFVASGKKFPDALGAGPLAYGIGPLLLVPESGPLPRSVVNEIKRIDPTFIQIIGGTATVSKGIAKDLSYLGSVERTDGPDRYAVAARVALLNQDLWLASDDNGDGQPDNEGINTVVLANGAGFADALGGGGAAANNRGSLLLTESDSLPPVTKEALRAIQPARVIIVGGTASVSSAVRNAVIKQLPKSYVVRASGATRYDAAVSLSKVAFPSGASAVFVTSGVKFPDALAGAPLAGLARASTLLTSGACVTSATRSEGSRLNPDAVVALGGTASVGTKSSKLQTC